MDSNEGPKPMPREELLWLVEYAKNLDCLRSAMPYISLLESRHRGINDPEVWALIDSIKNHYVEDVEKKADERAQERYDRQLKHFLKTHFNVPELGHLDDEQIIAAIHQIESHIKGHSSWCAIYIVLVSKCGWPRNYDGFQARVDRLIGLKLPKEKCFTYQGLQKGWNEGWPKEYNDWLTFQDGDATFEKQKSLAEIFLKHLEIQHLSQNT